MIVREKGRDFVPAPEGLHPAVCVDVVDMGIVRNRFGEGQKVRLVWEIPIRVQGEPKFGQFMTVSKLYTPSLNEKATLRKDLVSWRGRQFTQDELVGFELDSVIGVPCQVLVTHNVKDGKTFGNVTSVVKAGADKMRPSGTYVRVQDRPPEDSRTRRFTPPPGETDSAYLPGTQPDPADDDDIPF